MHSFHLLARLCSKSFKLGFSSMWTSRCTSWVYKRQRNQRPKCQNSLYHWENKGVQEEKKKTKTYIYVYTSVSLTMIKPLTMWITTSGGKFLKWMGVPDHLTWLLRSLYAGQEAMIRTSYGEKKKKDWLKSKKGVWQGCVLSPCLFSLNEEYPMQNARLKGSQARIQISGRNIGSLRYADDSTLMGES